jgi:predicted phosphodiesterase
MKFIKNLVLFLAFFYYIIFLVNEMRFVSANNPPYHIHLTYGTSENTENQIHVTWFTFDDQTESKVVWDIVSHTDPDDYTYSTIGTHTYYNNVEKCVHNANISGLIPNTRYYYRVGDNNPNEWSTERSFISGVNKTDFTSFNFIAYGDTRTINADREAVLNAINWEVNNSDVKFILHVGDIIENYDNLTQWNDWFEDAESVSSKVPIMTVEGNHDTGGNYWGVQYYNPQNGPLMGDINSSGGQENDYTYWFIYGNVFFINLDEDFHYADTEHSDYNWLGNTLEYANRLRLLQKIHWVVMQWHHPPYNSHTRNGEDLDIQNYLCPFIEERDVDVVFTGHEHFYEREYQLSSPDGIVENNASVISQNIKDSVPGTIYMIVGGGGGPIYTAGYPETLKNYTATHFFNNSYALINITIDLKTQMQTNFSIVGKNTIHNIFDDGVTLIKSGLSGPLNPELWITSADLNPNNSTSYLLKWNSNDIDSVDIELNGEIIEINQPAINIETGYEIHDLIPEQDNIIRLIGNISQYSFVDDSITILPFIDEFQNYGLILFWIVISVVGIPLLTQEVLLKYKKRSVFKSKNNLNFK